MVYDGYIILGEANDVTLQEYIIEEGYEVVREGVPRKFTKAFSDPVWGEPARVEWGTLTEKTGTLVQVNQDMAKDDIKNGANVMTLIPVYEIKQKEGKTVYKVRLVGDGRQHTIYGATYSATPSREEFLILMHVIASLDWEYYWVDESRAFLMADRTDTRPLYARVAGNPELLKVAKALYGAKDAPRDYRIRVDRIATEEVKCERLGMCTCIYVKRDEESMVVIFDHVDDFIFMVGNKPETRIKRMLG